MNRRTLVKALLGVPAIPLVVGGAEGKACEVKPGKTYLFVFTLGLDGDHILESLSHLGVRGSILFVDRPEHDLKIYEVEPEPKELEESIVELWRTLPHTGPDSLSYEAFHTQCRHVLSPHFKSGAKS